MELEHESGVYHIICQSHAKTAGKKRHPKKKKTLSFHFFHHFLVHLLLAVGESLKM